MEQDDVETIWNKIDKEAISNMNIYQFSNLRYGQSLFNVLCDVNPIIANKIRGTVYDCFHDDTKVDAFKSRVIELLHSEIQ